MAEAEHLEDLPDFTERRIDGEVIHDAGFMRLERDRVLTPSGNEAERHVVRHVGAVAVAAITPDERIVLVHQYRYAPGIHTIEIPAGKLDKSGEEALKCAQRELREETGYVSDDWSKMFETLSSTGFTDELLRVFLALDARRVGDPEPESDEHVKPLPMKLSEAYRLVGEGKVTECRTQLSLLWLKDRGIPSKAAFEGD